MTSYRAPASRVRRARLPLMALGMAALLGASWGGLVRLGWALPPVNPSLVAFHGPLMVSGFLGTVIGMERAVALGRRWAYAAPLGTGLGVLALLVGLPPGVGALLMTAGSVGLAVVSLAIVRRQPALFTVVMALGAVLWLAGQILWVFGWPIHRIVFWWTAFPVLTIAGERLEMARVLQLSRSSQAIFAVIIAVLIAGVALATVALDPGVQVVGLGLIALTLWLGGKDVARRTVRQSGLTRFIALCVLSGYGWLGLGGLLALLSDGAAAGPRYDALLHAVFLGFVFAMIFGHAPIIFPAVLGVPVAYRPAFYAHLILLHATLGLRMVGDLLPWLAGRQWGGLLNALVVLLFLASTAYGVLMPARTGRPRV
jgi:hypothetical protein